ncbi:MULTISPECIES: glycosyltransferase family 2 protein [Aphanothece]|uniref:glycosyltransferase family 2 protein n=1 Tax=Aphanothece TaxID=1121 RepID=UPI0039846854
MASVTLRQKLGCWLHERWRLELALRSPSEAWLDLRNRHERLTATDSGRARVCKWRDTSPLTVCRFFPRTGARLLRCCLQRWPVTFAAPPGERGQAEPQLSVIIAFRGKARLPQLRCCLASLWGQTGVRLEIIVVEQSWIPVLTPEDLPGVRLLHAPSTSPEMPFNKSWALNVGARQACSQSLVFHDADMVAPSSYGKATLDLFARGFSGALVPRFVFYLDRETSRQVQQTYALACVKSIDDVRANCRGVTLVMTRDAYWEIGGHDESFYGWGGEDDEILERAQTLRFYPGAFVPFVHLWHESQPEKHSGLIERQQFTDRRFAIPVNERIAQLRALKAGAIDGSGYEVGNAR